VSSICLLLYRKYLLDLVHCSLQRITVGRELNGHLPVSVDNMSFIAEKFVAAADMLPTLLVQSDDTEKQVCDCRLCQVVFMFAVVVVLQL